MEHASGSRTPCLWCAGNHPWDSLFQSPGLSPGWGHLMAGTARRQTQCVMKNWLFSPPFTRFSKFNTTKIASLDHKPRSSIFLMSLLEPAPSVFTPTDLTFFVREMETYFTRLRRCFFERELVHYVYAWEHGNAAEVHTKLLQNWGCYSPFLGGVIWRSLHLSFSWEACLPSGNCKKFSAVLLIKLLSFYWL